MPRFPLCLTEFHFVLHIFKKFIISPFSQYIHCWVNSLPKKSYSTLKFQCTTVSHLCIEVTCDSYFFRLFFRKIVFLSDQMVLGGPKYIPGYLRNISKKFSKNQKFFFTSKIFLGTSFRVAHAKKFNF